MANISPAQCRAARSLLSWRQDELEEASGIAKKTIADFERGARAPRGATLTLIRSTLEAAGIDFIDENGGGPGVRLRKK
jgi:transcriptional regulator with XRE-family HTH domain